VQSFLPKLGILSRVRVHKNGDFLLIANLCSPILIACNMTNSRSKLANLNINCIQELNWLTKFGHLPLAVSKSDSNHT
jgi:hypothetical protein